MPYFRNEGHYQSEDLSRDKFLGIFSHGGNKNLADLANFEKLAISSTSFILVLLIMLYKVDPTFESVYENQSVSIQKKAYGTVY